MIKGSLDDAFYSLPEYNANSDSRDYIDSARNELYCLKEDIEKKLKSYLHHREYDLNPLGIEKIKKMINEKKTIYNLKVDMRTNKFDGGNELKKIDLNLLPSYISNNKNKFSDWIED